MSLLPGKYRVHSPFVFHLITQVIEEHGTYYRLKEIERIRKRLQQSDRTTARRVAKEAISVRKGALLFRLTNHFKPQTILQVGTSLGLSTLYLSSYAAGLACASIEEDAAIAQRVYREAARTPIECYTGDVRQQLGDYLQKGKTLDFIFLNGRDKGIDLLETFTTCLPHTADHTVVVVDGIRRNKTARKAWQQIITHPEVTVSLEQFTLGIVLFHKNLHKRNYKIYFER
ncbi:class I SAM-dependent methyltransferase [Parabacteroides sp. PF5-6]|uniref:O-methyltransferase n=1 Tax=Parabacteroides sp. PF5-6 TaxID=1742403 RepID=UPI002406CA28|nr:class I SAM-dependent methyltransferase [Parabacteroides sp. PF5-6]MDF9830096.1 putative O-methyltransferase YrrM [Parabacteroides sp. PF5-6]